LIFDEPTNGLDPAGIHEIRATMRGLADQGKTVLVSSHILGEVQQVADTVSIIGRGNLLAEGDVEEILAASGESVRVGVRDEQAAAELLTTAGYAVTRQPDRFLSVSTPPVSKGAAGPASAGPLDPGLITKLLGEAGHWVHELTLQRGDLESVFLQLTAEDHLGASQHEGASRQGGASRHEAGPPHRGANR